MPKPFMIGIEVEEVALGSVLRRLNAIPGIVALHFDFDKIEKPASPNSKTAATNGNGAAHDDEPKRRGRPRKGEKEAPETFKETGDEAIVRILRGKTLSSAELRAEFEGLGRAPASVSSVLHKGLQSGAVVRSGRDAYTAKKGRRSKSKK